MIKLKHNADKFKRSLKGSRFLFPWVHFLREGLVGGSFDTTNETAGDTEG